MNPKSAAFFALACLTVLLTTPCRPGASAQTQATVFTNISYTSLYSADGRFVRETAATAVPSANSRCPVSASSTSPSTPMEHYLPATPETVNWGLYYNGLNPALVISSGDTVDIEFITHEGSNAYDLMVQGDPNLEAIYNWTEAGQTMSMRGAEGGGEGVHLLTGPIYVCGAEPGDVLQVEVLDLVPRPNPATGRTYGSNTAGSWGYHYNRFLDGDKREVVTIYEVIKDQSGRAVYAVPDHNFRWADPKTNHFSVVTPCTTDEGEVPNASPEGMALWNNYNYTYPKGLGVLPCIDGQQSWPQYAYAGCIANNKQRNYDVRGKWRSPANLHIGNMGVAPALEIAANSIPPTSSIGGNVDDRRFGVGATVYYPVQVAGAMFSGGDTHTAMGDSELDGTGIETSLNGKIRLTVLKQNSLPKAVQGLGSDGIIAENDNEYIVHGFTYNDYLSQLGPKAQSLIFQKNTQALDMAMEVTFNNTRRFMMNTFNLTEDEAISAMTVGVDFHVSQVVDGQWGLHAVIPKYLFNSSISPNSGYVPSVVTGTSMPVAQYMATATQTVMSNPIAVAG